MKVVLATGIYPPDIGGPATYVRHLAEEMAKKGVEVVVVTYGSAKLKAQSSESDWPITYVSKWGGPLLRWWRYAQALRKCGKDADVIYAFSSVSCGVPLWMARLKKPKKVLRLGGDFFWERYTDVGGMMSLREWYESRPQSQKAKHPLLGTFDRIVFSSRFQEKMYEKHFTRLPSHSVIENAVPGGQPQLHQKHDPFRLLFMGRFVGFKNLPALVRALSDLPNVALMFVGDGSTKRALQSLVSSLSLDDRVTFLSPVHGEEKQRMFDSHDLMVIPSITEITPNVALEARSAGLPVLLTEETGLSEALTQGMVLENLKEPAEMVHAIQRIQDDYDAGARNAAAPPPERSWQTVAEEHLSFFRLLV